MYFLLIYVFMVHKCHCAERNKITRTQCTDLYIFFISQAHYKKNNQIVIFFFYFHSKNLRLTTLPSVRIAPDDLREIRLKRSFIHRTHSESKKDAE